MLLHQQLHQEHSQGQADRLLLGVRDQVLVLVLVDQMVRASVVDSEVAALADLRAWVVLEEQMPPVPFPKPSEWRETVSSFNFRAIQSWTCSAFMSC